MFIDIAEITAKQSNCVKYKVGAVIVKDNRVIIQGYNGTVAGFINCSEKFGCCDINMDENRVIHNMWSSAFEVHAEMNCISYAARKGISIQDTIMYITHKPCNNCIKHIISSGIKKIIYKKDYIDNNQQEDINELLKFIEIEKYLY